jgi:hypothetical protein
MKAARNLQAVSHPNALGESGNLNKGFGFRAFLKCVL